MTPHYPPSTQPRQLYVACHRATAVCNVVRLAEEAASGHEALCRLGGWARRMPLPIHDCASTVRIFSACQCQCHARTMAAPSPAYTTERLRTTDRRVLCRAKPVSIADRPRGCHENAEHRPGLSALPPPEALRQRAACTAGRYLLPGETGPPPVLPRQPRASEHEFGR